MDVLRGDSGRAGDAERYLDKRRASPLPEGLAGRDELAHGGHVVGSDHGGLLGGLAAVFGAERHHLVATAPLGEVHRPVRLVDELVLERRVLGAGGYADADGQRVGARAELRLRDAGAHALGDLERAGFGGVDEDRRELLAAVARHQVDVPHGALEHAGDRAERLVARAVSVEVVEGAEVVKVAEEEGEARPLLLAAFDLLAETLVEVAVVVEAGEAVGDRLELGAAGLDRCVVEHRGEGLGHVAAQTLDFGDALRRGDVRRDDGDDGAVRVHARVRRR